MMRTALLTCGFILILFFGQAVDASRIAPKEVTPLEYNGIKYIVDDGKIGSVEAWDIKTNQKLWEKKVYDVVFNPLGDKDQRVYITSLRIQDNKLVVTNEAGKEYKLDPKIGDQAQSNNNSTLFYSIIVIIIILTGIIILSVKYRSDWFPEWWEPPGEW